jgi:hypothetical protein
MTKPTVQTPVSTRPSPTPGVPTGAGALDARRLLSDTPTRLATLATLAAVTALIFSIGSFWAIGQRSNADRAARVAAHQILVAQDAQTLLTEADAIATSGYLSGGLQDTESQLKFRDNVNKAASAIAELPQKPGSTDVSAAAGLTNYVKLVAVAQANNRLGYPVGATYQKKASQLLQTDVVAPLLANDAQARSDFRAALDRMTHLTRSLMLFALPFFLVAGVGLIFLSRLTKRTINIGVAAALVVVALTLFLTLTISAAARRDSLTYARGEFRSADLRRQATSSLFDARSQESQALIFRGNRSGYDAEWAASIQRAKGILGSGDALTAYMAAHASAAEADKSGDWDTAVESVVKKESRATFDAVIGEVRTSDPSSPSDAFPPFSPARLRLIAGLGGLLAAILAVTGFQRRLKEYR